MGGSSELPGPRVSANCGLTSRDRPARAAGHQPVRATWGADRGACPAPCACPGLGDPATETHCPAPGRDPDTQGKGGTLLGDSPASTESLCGARRANNSARACGITLDPAVPAAGAQGPVTQGLPGPDTSSRLWEG